MGGKKDYSLLKSLRGGGGIILVNYPRSVKEELKFELLTGGLSGQ